MAGRKQIGHSAACKWTAVRQSCRHSMTTVWLQSHPNSPAHLRSRVSQRLEAHALVQRGVAALQPLLEFGLHLALARHRRRQHLSQVVPEQQLQRGS